MSANIGGFANQENGRSIDEILGELQETTSNLSERNGRMEQAIGILGNQNAQINKSLDMLESRSEAVARIANKNSEDLKVLTKSQQNIEDLLHSSEIR